MFDKLNNIRINKFTTLLLNVPAVQQSHYTNFTASQFTSMILCTVKNCISIPMRSKLICGFSDFMDYTSMSDLTLL